MPDKPLAMTEATVMGHLDALYYRHQRVVFSTISLLSVLLCLSNLADQTFVRGLLYLVPALGLFGLVRYRKYHQPSQADDMLGLFLFGWIAVIGTWTNGGFDDVRGFCRPHVFLAAGMTAFGRTHANFVLWSSLAFLLLTFALDQSGVLNALRVQGKSDAHITLSTSIALLAVTLCFWLSAKFHKVQSELLIGSVTAADRARRAESRFLSKMSHEIRNPLNGITGLLHDIERHAVGLEEAQEAAHIALQSSQHLRDIVDDILDVKRLEAGAVTIVPETFDFQSYEQRKTRIWQAVARQKGIEFIVLTDTSQPRFLELDGKRFEQVMTNIIANAIKFTDQGAVTVSRRYHDGWLEVEVADTGIGMSPEAVDSLFTPFLQADNSISKRFGGSGLGLSIAAELVDLMGGTITVKSVLGEGSTFTVAIPAPVDEAREQQWRSGTWQDAMEASNDDGVTVEGLHILCVDDDLINLKVMRRQLERQGAHVAVAKSANEAQDLLSGQRFDVVLTDISMPDIDGEDLMLRLLDSWSGMPVVAVTGNVLPDDIERYLNAGFSAILAKPVSPDQLLKTIVQVLGGQGGVELGKREALPA